MKKRFLFLSLTIVTVLFAACGAAATFSEESEAGFAAPQAAVDRLSTAEPTFGSDGESTGPDQVNVQERLIIRNGSMDVVVEDTEESLAAIGRMAESTGGWVVTSSLNERGGGKYGSITVRVPADRFDATVEQIRALAVEVRSESTDSQDVTEEYIDLSARLDNLEATAERVRRFLDQARNVEEALEVNRELSRLESDIESLKGRIQFLERSAAFSSLDIRLTPDELSQPIEVAGWRPQGIFRDAIEALIGALQGVATLGIWALTFCLPLGLLAAVPLYLVVRFAIRPWRSRRAARSEEATGPAAEVEGDQEKVEA